MLGLIGCLNDGAEEIYYSIVQNEGLPTEREDLPIEKESPEEDIELEVDDDDNNDIIEDDNEILAPESDLVGALHIMIHEFEEFLPALAREFTRFHPDVEITFERIGLPSDISQQAALATRLLADPPDVICTSGFIFEKFSSEALFVDLKSLIDGENGVDRALFFNQVLTGAEENGSLFHVPLRISTETILLNKEYFEGIGVSVEEIKTLTIDQYLGYWHKAYELFPEDEIFIHPTFSMFDIFKFERGYDLQTETVNMDTPRMSEIFELARKAPRGSGERDGGIVLYTPEGLNIGIIITGGSIGAICPTFFSPPVNSMYFRVLDLTDSHIFMIAEHPDMKFSHPVQKVSEEGEIFFRAMSSPAILRNSENHDLAWEFIRFGLMYEDYEILWCRTVRAPNTPGNSFPVNRTLFKNHLTEILSKRYDVLVRTRTLEETGDREKDEETRARVVEESLQGFMNIVSMVNTERRTDYIVLHSLVYPDIYLLMSGQQDVEQTLMNIQGRLELYVSE